VIKRVITRSAVSSAWLKVPHREPAVVRELAAAISVGDRGVKDMSAGHPNRREAAAAETRREILRAARRLFAACTYVCAAPVASSPRLTGAERPSATSAEGFASDQADIADPRPARSRGPAVS
jgi:hypothetical protein